MQFIMCIVGALGIGGNDATPSPEDDSKASVLSRESLPKASVRWTEHALLNSSYNIRTRVYKVSLPNFR